MTSSTPPPVDPDEGGQQPADRNEAGSSYPSYPSTGNMPAYPQGSEPAPPAVPQPQPIRQAVLLMRAGAVLSMITLVVGLLTLGALKDNIRQQLIDSNKHYTQSDLDTAYNVGVAAVVIIGLLGVGLWLWMAQANGKGRKWARIVSTVLGVLNVIFTVMSLVQGQASAGSLILSVIGAILSMVILVLLWRRESSAYYTARSARQYS